MLSRIVKGALLGVGAGIVGSIASLTPFGLNLEENLGLEILFHLRGHRTPPPEVVVVGIDKESSDRFDLPNTERKFPRSLHADLTEKLSRRGAAVIAFDLFFEDPGVHGHDLAFAAAMRSAGNVVLCERLQFERVSLTDRSGTSGGVIEISRRIPPISLFEAAAPPRRRIRFPRFPRRFFVIGRSGRPRKTSRRLRYRWSHSRCTRFPRTPIFASSWRRYSPRTQAGFPAPRRNSSGRGGSRE